MSELSATNCGCGCENGGISNGNNSCLWIILLLCCCGGFGGGCINDTIIHLATSQMGFGGVGQSGMGSYHGYDSFRTFSHFRSIVQKSNRMDLPMRYQPYTKGKQHIVRWFMK